MASFIVETSKIGENVDAYQKEGMVLIKRGENHILRKRRQRPQKTTSKEMMIDANIVEKQDKSNKTNLNEGRREIKETKILKF